MSDKYKRAKEFLEKNEIPFETESDNCDSGINVFNMPLILQSFADQENKLYLEKIKNEIEAREKVNHKDGYDNGFIDGLQWLLNHLKQSNKE